MSKAQVKSTMGHPELIRGSMTNKFGQVVEVWQYQIWPHGGWSWEHHPYWFYFYDGKLVQYNQAGDWEREADKIYEIRFR